MNAADLIARLRRSSGYSQAELARRSGIPRTAINAYENSHRVPTAATLSRLAEACGHTLDVRSRAHVDEQANARALEQALDLADVLPHRRRGGLTFPPLAGR